MHIIYPGSFDPVTLGHIDIIERASKLFDTVTVAVLINQSKRCLFTIDERMELLRQSLKDYDNIYVDSFSGLLIDYLKKRDVSLILRGLRAVSDYENELQLALANRSQNNDIETVFLVASPEYSFLSSSLIREIASFHGDVSKFVPEVVEKALKLKYEEG